MTKPAPGAPSPTAPTESYNPPSPAAKDVYMLSMMHTEYIADFFILTILLWSAVSMLCARDLISAAVKGGVFSLALVCEYTVLAAPDVAITEAAVGAGMSTVLLLLAVFYVGNDNASKAHVSYTVPVIAAAFLAGMLCTVFFAAQEIGAAEAPAYAHLATEFIRRAGDETGIPNIVTSVLASYRGVDTFGEVTVIFAAAVIVYAVLAVRDGAYYENESYGSRTEDKRA